MASTQRSSRPRSCDTTSAAPGNRASQHSSHKRGFEVQMVGRLVEQQQVRVGEQRGGERHAHAPAAGKLLHRLLLRHRVETEARENCGGPRGGGLGVDGDQPVVDFRQMQRFGRFSSHAAGPTAPDRLPGPYPAGFSRPTAPVCRTCAEPRAGREPDVAAVRRNVAGDGAQKRGFPGAVAARPGRCAGRARRSGWRRSAGCVRPCAGSGRESPADLCCVSLLAPLCHACRRSQAPRCAPGNECSPACPARGA